MRRRLRMLSCAGAAYLCVVVTAAAVSGGRVLPVEAIDASATMRAADFNEAFPGVRATPDVLGVPGYFVVYEHENLRYYFGPVNGFGEARVWEDRLLAIRGDVVAQRPALATSRVYLYRFDYERSRAWSARHETSEAPPESAAGDVPSTPGGETPPEPTEESAEESADEEETMSPAPPAAETDAPRDDSAAPASPPREENTFWRFIRRVFGF
ncbi:MAG: hypothetical protein JJU00_01505 [Opitutales bacterium]|nr:hypothetical protein [Opitutales bacterium]